MIQVFYLLISLYMFASVAGLLLMVTSVDPIRHMMKESTLKLLIQHLVCSCFLSEGKETVRPLKLGHIHGFISGRTLSIVIRSEGILPILSHYHEA